MGNRGKGTKGKSAKKGKGGKGGKKGGGASKWGDESAGRDEGGEPVKKRRRFLTQENQDRQRRMKIMELSRAKERDHRQRLSKPNRETIEAAPATKRKRKKRKRPRDKRQGGSDDRSTAYYSSSDEEREERTDANGEDAVGGSNSGLASYKKLLLALESHNSSKKPSSRNDADNDLAAAIAARRMQRDGRDDYGNESESGEEDQGTEEEEEEEEEDNGEGSESEDDDIDLDSTSNGAEHTRDQADADDAEDDFNAAAAESETAGIDAEYEEADGTHAAGGRSKDEFCRHFISTPVFPRDKAVVLLSASGRPSFSAVSGATRGQWGAVGLAASASRDAKVPPALPATASNLSRDLGVLPSLADGWDACNGGQASKLQSLLLPSLTGYRDMLYCGWRDDDAEDIRRSYALHALNHALTSQRRVVRHTVRLRKAADEARVAEALARGKDSSAVAGAEVANGHGGNGARQKRGAKGGTPLAASAEANGAAAIGRTVDTVSEEWQRDQGFTRPKVLILLPFRGLAHELVEIMIGLLGPKTVVINKDRFDEEYGPDDTDDVEGAEVDGTVDGDARAERAKAVVDRKPQDWKALLGEGRNVDDMFTLGLSLSPGGGKGKPGEGKGVGVRLYCDFYNSDIIIASPVAMHRASVPAEEGGGEGESGVDSDFLSSVEVCIMDRADAFLMQNWAYVPDIAEVLNSRPTGERASRADFSRVRPLFLHDQGRLFRQTLVFSAYQDPNLNALVSKHFRNHDGVVKICRPNGDGHICEVALQVKQVFQRVPCDSPAAQDDARFEYFVGTVLPQLLRTKQGHTAVFIPSYFDYVRLRNHLIKNKVSAGNVHEYSRGSEVARSRARFFRGDRDLLLYTGRAHFFNRYCIRGIHHLIFYSLPECPQFYPEMVNLLEEAESVAAVTCLSLFTRFERLSLERIVGEERTKHMLDSAKNTFLFC